MSKKPSAKPAIRETDLYLPVKSLLEGQGYEVKSEIGAVDVVALREGEPPVIVELKTGITLSLFHQAIERQAITDHVYMAVPYNSGRPFHTALKRNTALCRRRSGVGRDAHRGAKRQRRRGSTRARGRGHRGRLPRGTRRRVRER